MRRRARAISSAPNKAQAQVSRLEGGCEDGFYGEREMLAGDFAGAKQGATSGRVDAAAECVERGRR
jgi:hypothetical protein